MLHFNNLHLQWKNAECENNGGHEPLDKDDKVNVDILWHPGDHALGQVDDSVLPLHRVWK